jgi:hypothetical protein
MKLQDIGSKTNTDKSRHSYKGISYLDIYDNLFQSVRLDVKNFVEVGVLNGSSLKMWKEYFPNAQIHGIDINPKCKQYEEDRINIYIGDQNDDQFLSKISKEIPEIDIFLDDGSHITQHQIKTFNHLFNNIKKGGFFVIEDLRNSYEEFNKDHDLRKIWPGMSHNKPEDKLKNVRSEFDNWMQAKIKQMDFHDNDNTICSIHNYPMIVVLEKFNS